MREKIERIWKLAYNKDAMLRSKIVSTQFWLGIVTKEMGHPISWVDFGEETNTSQCLKYQKRVTKVVATLKDTKKLTECMRTVKQEGDSKCEQDSKLTRPRAIDVFGRVLKSGRSK